MDKFLSTLELLMNDESIFPLSELLFLSLVFYALVKELRLLRGGSNLGRSVKRGEISWNYLYLAYGITSIILLQIINSANALEGYKTIISLTNLIALTYLTFFNSWFRNKIIGLISASKEMQEEQ